MITGQQQNMGHNYLHYMEFKDVSKELLLWLSELAIENNCRIEKKEWKSKYNSYVVYDYEPFCSDGFEINLTIASYVQETIDFIKYLYEEKLKKIDYLNNCLVN